MENILFIYLFTFIYLVCNATTLGVSNQSMIPDAQLAAYLSRYTSKATDGRLTAGAWCGENEFSWLQIDLGTETQMITSVIFIAF